MTTRTLTAGVAVMALVPTAASHVTGQESPAPRANVEFRVIVTPWDRPTYAGGSFRRQALEEGSSTDMSMQVRLLPASEGAPCTSSVTGGFSVAPQGPFPLWQVEATVRRARMDDIVVAYAWKRQSQTGEGSTTTTEGRGEANLFENGHVLLDYVSVQDAAAGCFRNFALELAASIPEDPAFADRRIAYDLWLVRENGGKSLTRRLQLIGKQGQDVSFDYGVFRTQLHGVPVPKRPIPTSDVMEVTVSGSVRSRIQADGSIELFLIAHRTARPADGRWATAAHGDKRVQVTPGETLRLELPPPTNFEGANEPETFQAIAEQRVSLVLTPTLVE